MAKKKTTKPPRRRFTDAVKANTVLRLREGSTVPKEAARLKCHTSMIYGWQADSRYQPGKSSPVLPTMEATKVARNTKPKPLVATRFECPHCGGAVEVAA
ncbi:MAG: hypothetical protein WBG86_16015 [Polyangiales bacterium]